MDFSKFKHDVIFFKMLGSIYPSVNTSEAAFHEDSEDILHNIWKKKTIVPRTDEI